MKKGVLLTALSLALYVGGSVGDGHESIEISLMGTGINVADLDRAEKFYSEVFEMKRTFQYPPEGKPLEIGLGRAGGGAALILAQFNNDPLPEEKKAYGRLIFNVSDAETVAKRAEKRGSTLRHVGVRGPKNPVIIFFDDLDGYDVELYQAGPVAE
jgi:catechol 2,3-dioxygenase-like lactoylglutathione lyase family enzyme